MIKSMMQNNPMAQDMIKQNPEMEYILSNPSIMRSILSPDMLKSTSGMIERMNVLPAESTMSGVPGSFPMPGSPEKKEEKTQNEPANMNPNANMNMNMGQPWMNPYATFNPMMGMPYMGQAMPNIPFQVPTPQTTVPVPVPESEPQSQPQPQEIDYKVKYSEKLKFMKDMGFLDEEANIKALKETNGEVSDAIEKVSNTDS